MINIYKTVLPNIVVASYVGPLSTGDGPELRWAGCVEYMLDFNDKMRQNYQISHQQFHVDYL